ncbi:MAG: carbon-nitrogen hydrolase family protein [Psychromonas sp.]|nr:carbon-nitrogen hydrolase family protein [Psychromonas sp.]
MSSNLSAIQLVSSTSAQKNLASINRLLKQLSPHKDQLVLLPENALCFGNRKSYLHLAETLANGPYQTQLALLAEQYNCYLVCGSFPIKSAIKDKIYTTSLVFSPAGKLISHYHKIHLFDADVSDEQGVYKESNTFVPGQSLQTFDWETEHGTYKVGLAICYDLRFPGVFQSLRKMGADILLLPAAFTQVTGLAHWLPLLQTRAIENQCYLVAANQGGTHECGRQTYGHSMVISPWGDIIEELNNGEGFVKAPFSKSKIEELRTSMPIMAHNQFTSILKN